MQTAQKDAEQTLGQYCEKQDTLYGTAFVWFDYNIFLETSQCQQNRVTEMHQADCQNDWISVLHFLQKYVIIGSIVFRL